MNAIQEYILDGSSFGAEKTTVTSRATTQYEVENSSGIDLIISRHTTAKNAKKTYLVLLASQQQYYVKDAKGNIDFLNYEVLRKFWSKLDDTFKTDNAVFDSFSKDNNYLKLFVEMVTEPWFKDAAKQNFVTASAYFAYNEAYHSASEVTPVKMMSYKTVVEYFLQAAEKTEEISRKKAITFFWKNVGTRNNKFSYDCLVPFIIIYNVYGLEVARKAIDMYAANDNIKSFRYQKLRSLFLTASSSYNNIDGMLVSKDELLEDVKINKPFESEKFLEYLFDVSAEEGFSDNLTDWCNEWDDTLSMQRTLFGKIRDKYPANLSSTHDKLAFIARRRDHEITKEQWEKSVSFMKANYEYNEPKSEWALIAPQVPMDMDDEAVQMGNCVSSYVEKVARGRTSVLFLRNRKNIDKSVCTVEINNGEVVQFKTRFNKTPKAAEYDALRNICEKKNILMPKFI